MLGERPEGRVGCRWKRQVGEGKEGVLEHAGGGRWLGSSRKGYLQVMIDMTCPHTPLSSSSTVRRGHGVPRVPARGSADQVE